MLILGRRSRSRCRSFYRVGRSSQLIAMPPSRSKSNCWCLTLALIHLLLVSTVTPLRAQRCSWMWQSARTLALADGRPAYVEAPAVVRNSTHVLLLGTPALTWAARDLFDLSPGVTASDTAVYLRRLASNTGFVGFLLDSTAVATALSAPTTGVMLNAVAVRGSGDTVHIVWNTDAPSASKFRASRRPLVFGISRRPLGRLATHSRSGPSRLEWRTTRGVGPRR